MPTIHAMDLPRPTNWQDFELLVRDAFAQAWASPQLQINGRQGQAQHGVDIVGADSIGRRVGIQCKRYAQILRLHDIREEVEKAESFSPPLSALFIATTCDNEAVLQQQVRALSDQRVASGKFGIGILFWGDIVAALQLNPAVFRVHYPQVVLAPSHYSNAERNLAALDLGYFSGDLWAYVELIYGEFGWMAQADTDALPAQLRVLERGIRLLFDNADAEPIIHAMGEVRRGCLAPGEGNAGWDAIKFYAQRVTSRMNAAVSLLPLAEGHVLDIGLHLGRMYHARGPVSVDGQRIMERKVRHVLAHADPAEITRVFASAADDGPPDSYRFAERIYGFLKREFRYG